MAIKNNKKVIEGYVIKHKDINMYITNSKQALGHLGDQSDYLVPDRTALFTKKPSTLKFKKDKYDIYKAVKVGYCIMLHDDFNRL